MKEISITEGNKIIAKFMGKTLIKPNRGHLKNISHYNGGFPKTFEIYESRGDWGGNRYTIKKIFFPRDLKYHKSWDWLMDVVNKIKILTYSKTIDECSDREWYVITKLTRLTVTTSIETVWKAVIEFINYYNSLNKNNENN